MFTDGNSADYKMNCKYDFFFVGEDPIPAQNMGYRISTREPWQMSIVDDAVELENREWTLMDNSDVKRD